MTLFIFSSPVVLFAAVELSWRIFLPSFFAATLAVPIAAVGLMLLAGRLFDAVIDPVIGWASDRFPTRFGLRRPWLAVGAPMISIGAIGVFWATPGTSIAALAGWGLLLHLGHRLTSTPHGGWGLELSRDPHERIRVMGAKIWVGAAGMIVVLLLPSLLERGLGVGRAAQVGALGAAIVLLAPVTAIVVLRCISEPDAAPTVRVVNPLTLFARMIRDREMRCILILYGLVGIADAAAAGTFLFFVEQALRLEGWGSVFILVQCTIPLVTLPYWARVSRRFGKERTLRLTYAWQAVVAPLALLLPSGNVFALAVWWIARNLTVGTEYMLLRAMVGDITRREIDQGQRWAASRYALFNVTRRIAMGLGIAMALGVLGWTGFEPAGHADAKIGYAIRLVHVVPASVAALLAILILSGGQVRRQSEKTATRGKMVGAVS